MVVLLFAVGVFGCLGGGGGGGGGGSSVIGPAGNTQVAVSGRAFFADRNLYGNIAISLVAGGNATLASTWPRASVTGRVTATTQTDGLGNFSFGVNEVSPGLYSLAATTGDNEVVFAKSVQVVSGNTSSVIDTALLAVASAKIDQIGSVSLRITFSSNAEATSRVRYYPASSPSSVIDLTVNDLPGTRHQKLVTGLVPNTGYVFEVVLHGSDNQDAGYAGLTANTTPGVGPSNLSIAINAGDVETHRKEVEILLSAEGATQMRLGTTEDLSNLSWEGYASNRVYNLPEGDGTKRIYVQFRDQAGRVSPIISDAIRLAADVRGYIGVWINKGSTVTKDTAVNLTLLYPGASKMIISPTEDFFDARWEFYSPSRAWNLAAGDGEKRVYAKFDAGSVSPAFSAGISLNTTGPVVAIKINNGALKTNNATVLLSLSGNNNPSEMQIQNGSSDFSQIPIWQGFANTVSWTLESGEGTKVVFARFRDRLGNVFGPISANIIVDTIAPSDYAFTINGGASSTISPKVTLGISAVDANWITISNREDLSEPVTERFKTLREWPLAGYGLQTVYMTFTDDASNTTSPISRTINVTGNAPVLIINGGDAFTTSSRVDLSVVATQQAKLWLSNDGNFNAVTPVNPPVGTTTISWNLPHRAGNRTVYAKFLDLQGVTNFANDAILTVGPASSSITCRDAQPLVTNPVNLGLYAEGATDMIVSEELTAMGGLTGWIPYSARSAFVLQAGVGPHSIYAKFRNSATDWIESEPITLSVTVATGAVIGLATPSLVINGNDPFTRRSNVTLTIAAASQTQMWLSNDGAFTGLSPLVPPAPPGYVSWMLSPQAGVKTVYARFVDASGSFSYANDSVEAIGPASTSVSTRDSLPLSSNWVNLDLYAEGATEMMISEDQTAMLGNAGWTSFLPRFPFRLLDGGGTHVVWVKFRNSTVNGIESVPQSLVLTVNNSGPAGNTLAIRAGASPESAVVSAVLVASLPVFLHTSLTDANTATVAWQLTRAGDPVPTAFRAMSPPIPPVLLTATDFPGSGLFYLWYKFLDFAGNASPLRVTSIDVQAPNVAYGAPVIGINNGDPTTSHGGITVSANAPGKRTMWLSNDGSFARSSPILLPAAMPVDVLWTLTPQPGNKVVYSRFQDASGTFTFANATIVAVGPASPSISTRDIQPLNSNWVNLELRAPGAIEMIVSEDPYAMNASTGWTGLVPTLPFGLRSPGGTHTIYAKFRSEVASYIESVPVTLTVTNVSGPPTNNDAAFRLSGDPSSAALSSCLIGSLPVYLHFALNDANTASIAWRLTQAGDPVPTTFSIATPPMAPIPMTIGQFGSPGLFYLWYRFTDGAGNSTPLKVMSIEIQSPNATYGAPTIAINDGDPSTGHAGVVVTVSAPNQQTMWLSNDGSFAPSTPVALPAVMPAYVSWTLPPQPGTKKVYARFRDASGTFTFTSASIVTVGPANPTISTRDVQPINSNWVNLDLYAEGALEMIVSENPLAMNATTGWALMQPSLPFMLQSPGGAHTIYAKFRSETASYVESLPVSVSVTNVSNPPTNNTAAFRPSADPGSAAITSSMVGSLPVYLHFTLSDANTASVAYALAPVGSPMPSTFTIATPPVTPIPMVASQFPGNGQFYLWYRYFNGAGNATPYEILPMNIQTPYTNYPPPVVKINEDDATTNSPAVTLNIDAPGQALMALSEDGNFAGHVAGGFGPVMPYTFSLSRRAGAMTIHAKFIDASGTYTYARDTITAVGPASPSISTRDVQPLNTNWVNLQLYANGAHWMLVSEDANDMDLATGWIPYQTTYLKQLLTPSGNHTMYAKFRNGPLIADPYIETVPVSVAVSNLNYAPSGNSAAFRLTAAPSSNETQQISVGSLPVYLHFTITDPNTATISWQLASGGAPLPTVFNNTSVPVGPIAFGPGGYTIPNGVNNLWYKFSDGVGNTTPLKVTSIDVLGPLVRISPQLPPSLGSGETQQFTATLANVSDNVVWSMIPPATGFRTAATPPSQYSTVYNAPNPVLPTDNYVDLSVQLQSDATVSDTVRIYLHTQIAVNVSNLSPTVTWGSSQSVLATFTFMQPTDVIVLSAPVAGQATYSTPVTIGSDIVATITYTANGPYPPTSVTTTVGPASDPGKSKTITWNIVSGDWINVNPASASVRQNGSTNYVAVTSQDPAPTNVYWHATQGGFGAVPPGVPDLIASPGNSVKYWATGPIGLASVIASFTDPTLVVRTFTVPLNITSPVSVTLSQSPLSPDLALATATSILYSATVTNATTTQVAWFYRCASEPTWWPAGSTASSAVADGSLSTSGQYQPPATYPQYPWGNGAPSRQIYVSARSLDDPTASAVATINLKDPLEVHIFQGFSNAGPEIGTTSADASTLPGIDVTLEVGTLQCFAEMRNAPLGANLTAKWYVQDIEGGNTTYGTIDATGKYTAPDTRPTSFVIIKAVSNADVSKSARAKINLLDFWAPRSGPSAAGLHDVTNATDSVYSVLLDPTTPAAANKRLFCGTNGHGVYSAQAPTTGTGTNWLDAAIQWAGAVPLSTPAIGAGSQYIVNGLTISLQHPLRIVAATASGAWLSTDGGSTFAALTIPGIRPIPLSAQNYGASFTTAFSTALISPVDDTYLFLVGRNQGVLRYTWNGATYVYNGTLYDDMQIYSKIEFANTTWTEDPPASPTTHVYENPYVVQTSSSSMQFNCIAADPVNADVIYVGYSDYLVSHAPDVFERGYLKFQSARSSHYISEATVTVFRQGINPPPFTDVDDYTPALPFPPYGRISISPFYSVTANCVRWIDGSAVGLILSMAVDPNTPTTVWKGRSDGVFRTTNDGTTWSQLGAYANVRSVLVDPINTVNVYLGCETGLYLTRDAGATWKQIKTGLEGHTTINSLSLSPGGWGFRRLFSATTAGVYMGNTTLDF